MATSRARRPHTRHTRPSRPLRPHLGRRPRRLHPHPSAVDEFRRAAARTDPSIRSLLGRFASNPPQSLTDWGCTIIGHGDDLSVVSTEHQRWNPTVDLARIAQRTAAAIDAEASHTAPTGLAQGIPRRSRRTPSTRSSPRHRQHPGRTAHHRPFRRPHDRRLHHRTRRATRLRADRSPRAGGFARLAIANGAVAVVVIARSVVQGVPASRTTARGNASTSHSPKHLPLTPQPKRLFSDLRQRLRADRH